MAAWRPIDLGRDAFLGMLTPKKLYQVIFNVQFTTTPTSVRITYVPMLDAFGFVTLFQDGVQIRGLAATPYAPSHFGVTFTDLPQNTTFGFRIDVVDPRPKSAQLPGGIVHFPGPDAIETALVETGQRTASVRLRWLKELQGEAEVTFYTRLYDWDGTSGTPISPIVQYGRGHMDPDGSPIGDPFGPTIALAQAPDSVAIYTYGDAETASPLLQVIEGGPAGTGINVVGMEGVFDTFPNDGPSLSYPTDYHAVMTGQTIVRLPSIKGLFNIPFSYMSGIGDYVFQVDGSIEGNVTGFRAMGTRSLRLEPRHLWSVTADAFAPVAMVASGDKIFTFQLTPDGRIARPRTGARTRGEVEFIGDVSAVCLVATARPDGNVDLIAVQADGSVLYAKAEPRGLVSWRELSAKLVGRPVATRSGDGSLHVFGLDEAGTLCHCAITDSNRTSPWDCWEQGLSSPISCATARGGEELHVLAQREGRIIHARLALGRGPSSQPDFATMDAPFHGPAVIGTTTDGGLGTLGWDSQGTFYVKRWDGTKWDPAGNRWQKIGNVDDLLVGEKQEPEGRSTAKPRSKRKAATA